MSADLECWSQFDVHAGHQVVLRQQQQSLAVDLLQSERLGYVAAAWKHAVGIKKNLCHHTHFNTIVNKLRSCLFVLYIVLNFVSQDVLKCSPCFKSSLKFNLTSL